MSALCNPRTKVAYVSGVNAGSSDPLLRPGGLSLTARAIAYADIGQGDTVLDLGCGAGDSLRYLQSLGIDAIGIDCEPSIDETLWPSHSSQARITASIEHLPFPDNSVAGILAECSLSLVDDLDRVLAECARVLTCGGRLMISDLYAREPNAISMVRKLSRSCASGMMVREELEATLASHGFSVALWEDHSQALREAAARFIFSSGSCDGLWQCEGEDSTETIQSAMKAARAGYFLVVAVRARRDIQSRRIQR
jgi:arsenite methyltransferase